MQLETCVALVTGSTSGIGLGIARALASAGADIMLNGFGEASEIAALCAGLEAEHRVRVGFDGSDLSTQAGVEALVAATVRDFGRVDVLVNNAGMSPLYPALEDISEELFDKVVGLNFKGPFRLSALIGSRMAKGDGGSIINISSTASLNPSPTSEPYGAAKAGLNSITRSFAFAYGPKVRVNCIVAGPFLTDIAKAWDMEAFNKLSAPRLALKRGGEPNEIVGAALYLASSSASFTTGTLVRVDGGTP
jgi:NAD(P)-dependent dehydrogenase (short-subunit alcohol dehydrogenase family)